MMISARNVQQWVTVTLASLSFKHNPLGRNTSGLVPYPDGLDQLLSADRCIGKVSYVIVSQNQTQGSVIDPRQSTPSLPQSTYQAQSNCGVRR